MWGRYILTRYHVFCCWTVTLMAEMWCWSMFNFWMVGSLKKPMDLGPLWIGIICDSYMWINYKSIQCKSNLQTDKTSQNPILRKSGTHSNCHSKASNPYQQAPFQPCADQKYYSSQMGEFSPRTRLKKNISKTHLYNRKCRWFPMPCWLKIKPRRGADRVGDLISFSSSGAPHGSYR